MLARIENRLKLWCNKWISNGGRLVLINSIIEAIPIYRITLTFVPSSILQGLRILCKTFLWGVKDKVQVFSWIAWQQIPRPKVLGGWGIKDLPYFSKALVAKCSSNTAIGSGLWNRLIHLKYIAPISTVEWI